MIFHTYVQRATVECKLDTPLPNIDPALSLDAALRLALAKDAFDHPY
jgi:hypothetical protein